MLKEKDKIKVHFYDGIKYPHKKIKNKTMNSDEVFTVCKRNGQLGIDFNTERKPSICGGAVFVPFACFAPCVEFENVETGNVYHHSTLTNKLEAVEEVTNNG